ncbi:MAG: purine-nucleoside phosphorylase [Bacteroidales bacterium]|jgi:purine-nucleoside phosphorylase|nr:purine-nucleoside phosphorylase [Bacteroidales bacterium]MDD3160339.1 purine-nucleoside phosphorylase [Bacteroidales bacterium]
MLNLIQEAAEFILAALSLQPEVAIVLGSGLGNLTSDMEVKEVIRYQDIPHFPVSTVEGHEGKLICGMLAGKPVLVMSGRFHYYEGYSMKEVTFPVRVMQQLGIRYLFLSNAAGGLNPLFQMGDVMLITDHINYFPENPLRGKNHSELGERFPDMSEAYDKQLRALVLQISAEKGISLRQGVYVGTSGPSYETPAETRFFRTIGADAVGMSTIPEVIVARHGGIRVVAFSVITNCNNPDNMLQTSHSEVQRVARQAETALRSIIYELIKSL